MFLGSVCWSCWQVLRWITETCRGILCSQRSCQVRSISCVFFFTGLDRSRLTDLDRLIYTVFQKNEAPKFWP